MTVTLHQPMVSILDHGHVCNQFCYALQLRNEPQPEPVPEPPRRIFFVPERHCQQPDCTLPVLAIDRCTQHYLLAQKAARRYSYQVWGDLVLERDKRICHLCRQHIPRQAKWPDPWSFSLDHVQPQSLGGFHDHTNLRAAHLRCNQSRGNKLMEVLNPFDGPDYQQRFTNWWGDWKPSFRRAQA